MAIRKCPKMIGFQRESMAMPELGYRLGTIRPAVWTGFMQFVSETSIQIASETTARLCLLICLI